MTNCIFFFTGNVVSSPTVLYLAKTKKVWIPVFEDLDRYVLKRRGFSQQEIELFLPDAVDAVFARDQNRFDTYGLGAPTMAPLTKSSQNFIRTTQVPTLESMPHTAFKWRSISSDRLNALMKEVFERRGVKPIVILRRKLWPQCTKLVLSELFDGSPHMQFQAGEMSAELYQEYRLKQQGYTIEGDESLFLKIESRMERFLEKSQRLLKYVTDAFPRNPDKVLLYAEDLFGNDVHKPEYEKIMSDIFCDSLSIGEVGGIPTRKAGTSLDSLRNLAQLLDREMIQHLEGQYQNALRSFEAIAKAMP